MKQKFCLVIIFSLSVVTQVCAQNLVVRQWNGIENVVALNTVQKLYFSGNDLVVDFISGSDDVYAISALQKLYFDFAVSIMDPSITGDEISVHPNPAKEVIIVENLPVSGGELDIYSIDGRLVHRTEVISERESIDVNTWPDGLYLVKIQGLTAKFIKL